MCPGLRSDVGSGTEACKACACELRPLLGTRALQAAQDRTLGETQAEEDQKEDKARWEWERGSRALRRTSYVLCLKGNRGGSAKNLEVGPWGQNLDGGA